MAIKLVSTYSKKVGLPGYSSLSFGASVEVELTDIAQVEAECARLYRLLQHSVDQQIQSSTGFVPDAAYGVANGNDNGKPANTRNGNGESAAPWRCSEKQSELIQKIVRENNLDKNEVEHMAKEMFGGAGVRQLDKLQASGLIDELLERHGGKRRNGKSRTRREPASTNNGGARS